MKNTPKTLRKSRRDGASPTPADHTHSVPDPPEASDNDDLDFVVTEAHDNDTELVGGFKTSQVDDLGIESNADMMDQEAARDETDTDETQEITISPIGDSTPPPPPPADYSQDQESSTPPDPVDSAPERDTGLEKLSDKRLQELSEKMRGNPEKSDYLSAEEKHRLINSIDQASASETAPDGEKTRTPTVFDNQPIVPPRKKSQAATPAPEVELKGDKPKIAKRLRGIAYFAKGYIKIAGEQELHEGDELIINGREYLLRAKKISNRLLWGVLGPVVAVSIFALGAIFSADANLGSGRIVGMALDANDQPFLTKARVRFPELGRVSETNSQGFFMSDPLEAGSYKIEFVVGDNVVATDYATVVDGRITTLALRPEVQKPGLPNWSRDERQPAQPQGTSASSPENVSPPGSNASRPTASSNKTGSSKTSAAAKWSKLALAANIEGARLTVDGSVLGAGNLTYPRLKPGRHSYAVSLGGYETVRGTIRLRAGKTSTLKVKLVSDGSAQRADVAPEQEHYNSAVSALEEGQINAAIGSLNQAIELNPSFAEAYLKRAEAYRQKRDSKVAHDDFVRAAEIYQFRKDTPRAMAAYEKAIKLNSKSVAAYLGRGNLYLSRGEDIAAIADFDMVIRSDKRNMQGYIGLGTARYNQGYYKKATKHFKDARSIDKKNPIIHQHLMLSYFKEGDIKQVKKSFEKFIKFASDTQVERMRNDSRFAPVLRVIAE